MTYSEFQNGKYAFLVIIRHKKTKERYCLNLNADSIEEAKAKYSAPPWADDINFNFAGLNAHN